MKNLLEDKKAKTKSFFFKNQNSKFEKKHIDFLKNYYLKKKTDIRICIHKNPKEKHHDMIILQQKKNTYLPHKHQKKGETYHMIYGKMACILFNNNGSIKKLTIIKKNDIFRTPINVFHTMVPLKPFVIYHESKIGPMRKKSDSIFPKWACKLDKNKILALINEK